VPHVPPGVPPLMAPQPPHALSAGWHDVPSQHPPLHVRPPAQLVPHVALVVLHAWAVGQSPGAAHPHVPVRHEWPAAALVQSTQAAPVDPHALAADCPPTQSPVVWLQQPPLHGAVEPQAFVHAFVAGLQAWLVGHWLDCVQPQLPLTHWLVPVHAPHAAPLVPHAALVVAVTHVPVALQQPVGQLVEVQRFAHCPEPQAWATVHVWHEMPPVPQVVDDSSVWHCPSVPQQPPAQVVAPQGGEPASVTLPVSPAASAASGSVVWSPVASVGSGPSAVASVVASVVASADTVPSVAASCPGVASPACPPSPGPPPPSAAATSDVASAPTSSGVGTSLIPQTRPQADVERAKRRATAA